MLRMSSTPVWMWSYMYRKQRQPDTWRAVLCKGPAVMEAPQTLPFCEVGSRGVLSCWAHRGSLPSPTGSSFLDWIVRLRSARLAPSRRARARRLPQPGGVRLARGLLRAGLRSSAYCLSHTVLAKLLPYFRPGPAHWFPRQVPLLPPASTTPPDINPSLPIFPSSSL